MAKTILSSTRTTASATGVATSGATEFWWLGYASSLPDPTEANREITYRAAGTVSKLYVRVIANATSASSTLTVRKNGADTALTVTIPTGTNGVFEYTSGTVSVAAGDKLCYKSVCGAGSDLTFSIISVIYDSTTNCTTRYVTEPYQLATASVTQFLPIAGNRSGTTTAEANCENTIKTAGTIKNAFAYVASNGRTTTTTLTLRKNRADTAIVLTYTSGQTGIKEDLANSVSFTADDELDWEYTTSTGTGFIDLITLACDYETTTSNGVLTRGNVGSTADVLINEPVTWYFPLGGGAFEGGTTEADAQMKAREAFTFKNLILYAGINNITATSTFRLRVNGADSALTFDIASSATGFFADTTHTVTVAENDLICLAITTGSAAGAVTMTTRQFGITTLLAGANITRSLTTEALTLGESLGMVRGKARTVSQTLTLGESATRQATKIRAVPTQALTLGESVTRSRGPKRTISQTLTLGESLTLKRDKIRTRSETLILGESATRQKAANRSISQSLTLSEAVTRIKGIPRSIAQTLTLGESLARKADKTRTVSQSLILGESAVRKKSAFRSIAQTLVLSDAVVKSRTVIRSITQTLTLGESLARMAAKTRAISQTVIVGESLNRLKSATRSLSQSLTLTDLAERFRGGVSRSLSESLTVGDSVTRKADKTRSIAQTLTLSEALNRLKAITRAVPTQSLTLSDLVIRVRGRVRAINETLTLGESLTRQASKIRAIAQTLTLSDNATQSRAGQQNIVRAVPTESLTVGDSITRQTNKIRAIAQALTLGESLNRLAAKKRALATQVLAISDIVARVKTHVIVKTLTENLTIGDSVTRRAAKIRTIAQTLTVTDVLQAFKNGIELIPPIVEPPNLIGFKKVFVRKPRYTVRIQEIKTVEQKANSPISIPAFKYAINKVWSPITIVEWLQKATSRVKIVPLHLAASVKASVKIVSIDQIARVSAIRIVPPELMIKAKSKILNPEAQHRFSKIVKLFFMVDKLD